MLRMLASTSAPVALSSFRGRQPVLLVFYLGFGCLHCVEQLKALAPKGLNVVFENVGGAGGMTGAGHRPAR